MPDATIECVVAAIDKTRAKASSFISKYLSVKEKKRFLFYGTVPIRWQPPGFKRSFTLAKSEITKASPGRIPSHKLAQHEDAFLDAASALFNEHGLARVSIDMIARAARVSTKTIYARYGGKLGLFSAVIRKQIAPILATQDAFLSSQNDDPIKLLRNVAAAFVERLLDPNVISLHRMMIAEASHMPELSELYYREVFERAQNRLADWLSKQDAAGLFKIPNPKRAAEMFAALVGAGIFDRAHLLNVVPSATERTEQLDHAISVFSRAYEIRQHPKG